MRKQKVKLNRPIYIGFTCLEYAKHLMYKTYYENFKPFYKDRITLAYTDTDSFLLVTKTRDFYMDLKNHFSHIMDFSNYPRDHFLHDNCNAKVVGLFKDEFAGQTIKEFIGLKPKLYSILYDGGKFKNTAKGLQRSVLKKTINHNHYRNVLFQRKTIQSVMRRIQLKEHKLSTIETIKRVFTPLDDKRYYKDDGISSLGFGHYSIV